MNETTNSQTMTIINMHKPTREKREIKSKKNKNN